MSTPRIVNRRLRFYLLIAAGLATRAWAVWAHNPMDALGTDPGRHWKHAIETLGFDPMKGIDPVGFQIFLGAVAKLTLGDRTAIAIYAALLSILTPWLWYRFARELFYARHDGRDLALLCFAALAWLPSWIGIFSYFMTETLVLPLFGAALWACWRALRKQETRSMLVAVLLATMTILTRLAPVAVLLPVMAAVLWVQPRCGRALLYSALLALAMILPAGYRSQHILHVWAPFGYPPMNTLYYRSGCREINLTINEGGYGWFYGFASPQIGQEPLRPLSHWQTSRECLVKADIDLMNGSKDWDAAVSAHTPSLGGWLRLWKENAIFLLVGESWPDNDPEHFWELIQIHARWMWLALIPLVVVGNCVLFARHKYVTLLGAAMVITLVGLVVQTTAYIEGRYRKPFEGLIVISAVGLVAEKWRLVDQTSSTAPV